MRKKINFKSMLIVAASVYIGYILISTQISMNRIKNEMQVKQQELTKVKEKNQTLQDEVNNMTNNPDAYTEKMARERLGLVKDGETPVIEKK